MGKNRDSMKSETEGTGGRSQSGLRLHNERQILSLIRRLGAAPKAEIATETGLSAQAVTVIINKLEADKLLLKGRPQRGRVGQPSIPYSLNPDGAFAYGLNIGRRSYDLTLEDFVGNVRGALQEPCDYPTVDGMLSFLSRGVEFLKGSIKTEYIPRIRGIGIATPFELWRWAREIGAPEEVLEQWHHFEFAQRVTPVVEYPVYVCNDDTAACVAELIFGNPNLYGDFIYFFIGSFIGGGVVINHSPVPGSRGNAGALGSMPVPTLQEDGTLGYEQLIQSASLTTLEEMLKTRGQDSSTIWRSIDYWDTLEPTLGEWVEKVSDRLAYASVCAVSLIDFEAVIIDGAIPTSVLQRLVTRTKEKLKNADLRGLSPFVVTQGTIGSRAQSIGSASLPLSANFFNTDSNLFLTTKAEPQ